MLVENCSSKHSIEIQSLQLFFKLLAVRYLWAIKKQNAVLLWLQKALLRKPLCGVFPVYKAIKSEISQSKTSERKSLFASNFCFYTTSQKRLFDKNRNCLLQ